MITKDPALMRLFSFARIKAFVIMKPSVDHRRDRSGQSARLAWRDQRDARRSPAVSPADASRRLDQYIHPASCCYQTNGSVDP